MLKNEIGNLHLLSRMFSDGSGYLSGYRSTASTAVPALTSSSACWFAG
jgi:hypothetical protein